ncbi:trypsin-like peptidase domain-containing protein [Albimonas sp. CAU 1670]|uniref:trypsin-like serine peptidase n=1 Tax=Albimonas sp. CAU 1670 TaxID=3032599 RepID=UPI0023DADF2B|nr:trypsin-like peptidase domain-containing protein [Albimonas sp. CAU 1670]MDF2234635.1 trypsin-like peptidase domain-containing protein [Albimonas sp. CAU 1670]
MYVAYRLLAAFLAVAPLGAPSASAEARALATEAQQTRFVAVGRLNVGGQGHCTATLIEPDLALTAAHCLVNRRTGATWRAERLVFLPGWHIDAAAAVMRGRAAALAPGYLENPGPARDLALIRVSEAAEGAPNPIPVASAEALAASVLALSYGRDRGQALSVQSGCAVVARQGDLLRTDCDALPGISGAPLVREGADGPELVGVIVASVGAEPPAMLGPALAVAPQGLMPGLRRALAQAEAAQ